MLKGMNNKISFEELKELDYYHLLNRTVEENPYSVDGEPLIYDEHRTLLVAAFIAKDFLKVIHFPDLLGKERALHVSRYTKYWLDLIEDSIITPEYPGYPNGNGNSEPKDLYLLEIMKNTDFKGFRHPKDYPFLIHVGGDPYVSYWNALAWAKKAYKHSLEQSKKGDER